MSSPSVPPVYQIASPHRSLASPAGGLFSRIVVGLATVAAAFLVRVPLEPILQGHNTFILIEPAIAIAAWYGGRVSGTVATLTGVVASDLLYLDPAGTFTLPPQTDSLSLALFAINGFVLTFLSAGLKNAFVRADRARVKAEDFAAISHRLQLISLALNRPMSTRQLAQIAIEQSVELLGANGGVMAVGRAGDSHLRVMSTYGYVGDVKPDMEIAAQGTPLLEAITTGAAIVLHGREERIARYPALADQFVSTGDSMALPLLYQGTATGSIYLNFPGRARYGEDDREFLRSIGAQIGSAFERSILIGKTNLMAAEEKARAAELSTVLEAIGEGVLVGDERGRVILANSASETLLGKSPRTLADLPERVDDPPGEASSTNRYLARSPNRARGWLEIVRFPVPGETASSDVVLIRDVTSLVEADLQRDAFLGVLSHELRTPVTSILIAVDLLRRGTSTPRRRGELLNDVDAESTRLSNIVEDLLVLTRSERGALEVTREPVILQRLIGEVLVRTRVASPEVDVALEVDGSLPLVEAEPTYVEQILRNLVSNAIKYGQAAGKPIEISMRQRGDFVETRVMDRGVGFGPGEAERLFTLFYRNPRAVRSAPGAGIGLYVCRLLAEAMGGTTWARPRAGGGAEFGFSLPVLQHLDGRRRSPSYASGEVSSRQGESERRPARAGAARDAATPPDGTREDGHGTDRAGAGKGADESAGPERESAWHSSRG